jgi:hypothetical protein
MPHSAPGTSDEKLIEAETEILALRSQSAALRAAGDRSAHPEISDRVFGLDNLVAGMPAQTLAGAAVKLRRLADPESGIEDGMAEGNPRSIRHVLDVVVRLLGGEDGKKFRAAEEQVAEAYRVAAQDTSSDGAAAAAAYEGYLAGVAFVELTEPQSLVAVMIKLRHLLVAGEPLSGYDREQDSVRQCVAFLDRQIGWGASPRGGHD